MPYTLCHPAIGLPLRKVKFINFTCFVLGTMAPDLEYFYLFFSSGYSHTLEGLFWFCLPAGWLLYVLWERYWRIALNHFFEDSPFSPSKLELVKGTASILLGSSTHILWDSLTHQSITTKTFFPSLSGSVTFLGNHSVPVYNILQHGSTVVGAIALSLFFYLWPRTPKKWNYRYLINFMLCGALSCVLMTTVFSQFAVHSNPIVLMGLSLMIFLFISLTIIGVSDRLKTAK